MVKGPSPSVGRAFCGTKKTPQKGILSLRSLRITLAELGPSRNMGIKHEKVQFAFFPFIMFGA